ncbi:MAG TPA: hypothetical protein VMP01_13265 [Pirellulaceae bacterium]|nr:hypothetical protein [Pirellulaceae bacterium]
MIQIPALKLVEFRVRISEGALAKGPIPVPFLTLRPVGRPQTNVAHVPLTVTKDSGDGVILAALVHPLRRRGELQLVVEVSQQPIAQYPIRVVD